MLQYFEEAHACFLYGFPIACAVLCRAILESALTTVVDPNEAIKKNLPKESSYFEALVENAKQLKDDREGQDDRPCALDVKRAGNWAIHKLKKFNQTYGSERLAEVLNDTRRVLVDLYAVSRSQ